MKIKSFSMNDHLWESAFGGYNGNKSERLAKLIYYGLEVENNSSRHKAHEMGRLKTEINKLEDENINLKRELKEAKQKKRKNPGFRPRMVGGC